MENNPEAYRKKRAFEKEKERAKEIRKDLDSFRATEAANRQSQRQKEMENNSGAYRKKRASGKERERANDLQRYPDAFREREAVGRQG